MKMNRPNRFIGVFLILVLAILALCPAPTPAAPKWVTAVPRAVGRNYQNMFTFKHPWTAVQQWAVVGAGIFDVKTTSDVFSRCAACFERNPLSFWAGRRMNKPTLTVIAIVGTTFETTWVKYGEELGENQSSRFYRNLYSVDSAAFVGLHTGAGVHNIGVR